MAYLHNVLIGIDQLTNTLLGGMPDETLSSRVGRGAVSGNRLALIAEFLIDAVFGPGHCRRNIEPQFK